ncbi:MAG: DUF3786 domain-containing protein [Deltaproteobacteria bacterium]|nr:DUF3786 domain-containing protein [Deltaproteobacteria bacterium]
MTKTDSVFEQTYQHYLTQISQLNLIDLKERLGIRIHDNQAIVEVFGQPHRISGEGIIGPSEKRPSFDICIILSKYILLCPDLPTQKKGWVSFRDFKDSGPLLKFYANDVEKAIADRFSGKINTLKENGKTIGGYSPNLELSYDFCMQFDVLPKIPLLLLFNDADNEFPAACSVLFQNDAEKYLDAECLSMVGVLLLTRLRKASPV